MEVRRYAREAIFSKPVGAEFSADEIFEELEARARKDGKVVNLLMKQEVLSMLNMLVFGKGVIHLPNDKYKVKTRSQK